MFGLHRAKLRSSSIWKTIKVKIWVHTKNQLPWSPEQSMTIIIGLSKGFVEYSEKETDTEVINYSLSRPGFLPLTGD